MKTVIEMAYKVFDVETDDRGRQTFSIDTYGIERFAELVRADEQNKWQDQTAVEIHEAILEEREACAKVCDDLHPGLATKRAAEIIRARGNT